MTNLNPVALALLLIFMAMLTDRVADVITSYDNLPKEAPATNYFIFAALFASCVLFAVLAIINLGN